MIVFFSLDKEKTWHHAIDKEYDPRTWEQHVQEMKAFEATIRQTNADAANRVKTILQGLERPLVLNGLRKSPRFQHLDEAQHDLERVTRPKAYIIPQDAHDDQEVPRNRRIIGRKRSRTDNEDNTGSQRDEAVRPHTEDNTLSPSRPTSPHEDDEDIDDFLARFRE